MSKSVKALVVLTLSLAVCAAGAAAPPELKLTVAKPGAKAGDLVKVAAETAAKAVRWKVVGDAQWEADSNGRSVVLVIGAGKVSVFAIAASETGELSEFAEQSFELASPPAPAVSSLGKSLRESLSNLPAAEAALAPKLQQFYADAAALAKDETLLTWGDLFAAMKLKSGPISGKMVSTQTLINAEIAASLPKLVDTDAVDAAGRAKAVAVFKKVATALGEAQK